MQINQTYSVIIVTFFFLSTVYRSALAVQFCSRISLTARKDQETEKMDSFIQDELIVLRRLLPEGKTSTQGAFQVTRV